MGHHRRQDAHQSGNGNFTNTGTLRKSAGTGTALLNGYFSSTHPTFDVKAGVLQLADQSTFTGGAQINADTGAIFRLKSDDGNCCWVTSATGTLTGSGGGRFELVNGDITRRRTLNFPAGFFHSTGRLYGITNSGEITLDGGIV